MATQSPAAAALRLSAISCRALRRTTPAATKARLYSSGPARLSPPSPLPPTPHQRRPQLPATSRRRSSSQARSVAGAATSFHTSQQDPRQRRPLAHNREPVPDQPPPTDFGRMDVLGGAPVPATAVKTCHADGFSLQSGTRLAGGDGALLVGGEAFAWRPWLGDGAGGGGGGGSGMSGMGEGKGRRRRLVNDKGQWEVGEEGFALLGVLWPRPDLLILGLGPEIRPLSPATRRIISDLGMRVEVLDTRNAASQYNMLATERGVGDVAAALIPLGWKDGE
ncbi:NADH dehydrogenase [ubiquinone] 1 alpha subcomplex assembly factor 3 [Madurella fahalii]|uniref:NADH dehydrogenase [ubiquinone] 1 alpha subcomplex assembly factor 3 n=1 Tax=Madurella fahalii TaxID=1157608 RepID=A0ABQ0GT06_9PEZI